VDGRTGALVPPRDVGVLAQRLREMLADPARLAAMGSAAAARARTRYGWDTVAAETESLYRDAVSARPGLAAAEGSRS
jgi:glycosyltransferase involved in cell wall biosynthesis